MARCSAQSTAAGARSRRPWETCGAHCPAAPPSLAGALDSGRMLPVRHRGAGRCRPRGESACEGRALCTREPPPGGHRTALTAQLRPHRSGSDPDLGPPQATVAAHEELPLTAQTPGGCRHAVHSPAPAGTGQISGECALPGKAGEGRSQKRRERKPSLGA